MKEILIAFPQHRGSGHDSMSIYHSNVKEELVNLGWNVLEVIPQNYETILNRLLPSLSSIIRHAFPVARATRSWILEYWLFLFFLKLNKSSPPLVAISQEYAPIFNKKKSIVIVHDMIQQNFPRSMQAKIFYKNIIPWALRKCSGIISVSKTTQSILMQYKISSNVVYNSIDLATQEKTQNSKNESKSISTVLWVGTAAKHKSLDTLLLAAAQTPELTFNVILPERDSSLIPKPSSNVYFHSNISNHTLRDLYLNTDIFVSTSLDEGYGRPAMEARILGCRLILSDLSIYRELHAGAAIFFPPGDSKMLAAALKTSIKNDTNEFQYSLHGLIAEKDELAKELSKLALKIL